MKTKQTLLFFLFFSVVLVVISENTVARADENTIIVPDEYDSIQEAINAANDGDTVFVKPGKYHGCVVINKSLSLIGENKETTTIVGDWALNGTVVLVQNDNVIIQNFTIETDVTSMLMGRSVHLLHVKQCKVLTCNLNADGIGVWLYGSSENIIENNLFDGTGSDFYASGIKLQNSHYNSVTGNRISNYSSGFGIVLETSTENQLSGNQISNCYYGIWFSSSNNNKVSANSITLTANIFMRLDENVKRSNVALRLFSSSSNIITNNIVLNCSNGIQLRTSSYFNLVENNTITNSTFCGLEFADDASHNIILKNEVITSEHGLEIKFCSNNTLKNNYILDAEYSFLVNGTELHHFIQDFDDSNILNGMPVCYWVNKYDAIAPLNTGFLVLVNCTNITVTGLEISNNYDGVFLAYTTNSIISKNVFVENYFGVKLYQSTHNSILENNIKQNFWAIRLHKSKENSITGNNITSNNKHGLLFSYSTNNNITNNNIANNQIGTSFVNSSSNVVYHNNFINNKEHVNIKKTAIGYVSLPDGMHSFDNGYSSGGNYWDDYNGTDTNQDGIGDTPYLVSEYRNNKDKYPLMEPIKIEVISEFSPSVILFLVIVAGLLLIFVRKIW